MENEPLESQVYRRMLNKEDDYWKDIGEGVIILTLKILSLSERANWNGWSAHKGSLLIEQELSLESLITPPFSKNLYSEDKKNYWLIAAEIEDLISLDVEVLDDPDSQDPNEKRGAAHCLLKTQPVHPLVPDKILTTKAEVREHIREILKKFYIIKFE